VEVLDPSNKLRPRSTTAKLIGYVSSGTYKCGAPSGKIYITKDVRFDETRVLQKASHQIPADFFKIPAHRLPNIPRTQRLEKELEEETTDEDTESDIDASEDGPELVDVPQEEVEHQPENKAVDAEEELKQPELVDEEPIPRRSVRSQRGVALPKWRIEDMQNAAVATHVQSVTGAFPSLQRTVKNPASILCRRIEDALTKGERWTSATDGGASDDLETAWIGSLISDVQECLNTEKCTDKIWRSSVDKQWFTGFMEELLIDDFCAQAMLKQNGATTKIPTVPEAARDEAWFKAMLDEFHSHMQNGTWKLVPPSGDPVIDSKWILTRKPDRLKARLVARGFTAVPGVHYFETFSPVPRLTSFRILMALAGPMKLRLRQFDVKTAFLQARFTEGETIHMRQPQHFVQEGKEDWTCLLQRPIYGLPQAPRAWNKRLVSELKRLGFQTQQQRADPCVFVLKQDNDLAITIVWVDDFIMATNSEKLDIKMRDQLQATFDMRDMGAPKVFAGMEIQQTDQGIYVTQSTLINELVGEFGMLEANPRSTPMDDAKLFKCEQDDEICSTEEERQYRHGVGVNLFLNNTRPDISFAVSQLSKFISQPGKQHFQALKQLLRYLKGTQHLGIFYPSEGSCKLQCYVDASWASDPNDGRSVTGYVYLLNGSPISWSSKKQATVAKSTSEAEFYAMSGAASEGAWILQFLQQVGCGSFETNQIQMLEDNQGAEKFATNPIAHPGLKQVGVHHLFIREMIEDGLVQLQHVASEENIADVCTKPLAKTKFLKFREKLRMDQRLMRIRDKEETANSVETKSGACQTKHSQGASTLLYLLI
jgi:hypothetical protein